jgi:hypothetical protein
VEAELADLIVESTEEDAILSREWPGATVQEETKFQKVFEPGDAEVERLERLN